MYVVNIRVHVVLLMTAPTIEGISKCYGGGS